MTGDANPVADPDPDAVSVSDATFISVGAEETLQGLEYPSLQMRDVALQLGSRQDRKMAVNWSLELGTIEDGRRFIRQRAAAMSPEDGLTALEELRRVHYDDPEDPPRLERVFVLFAGPRREVCGRGGLRTGDSG